MQDTTLLVPARRRGLLESLQDHIIGHASRKDPAKVAFGDPSASPISRIEVRTLSSSSRRQRHARASVLTRVSSGGDSVTIVCTFDKLTLYERYRIG